jgi:hypothetical protein
MNTCPSHKWISWNPFWLLDDIITGHRCQWSHRWVSPCRSKEEYFAGMPQGEADTSTACTGSTDWLNTICGSMKILQFGVLQKSVWASVFWVLWMSLAWYWSHMDASMKKPQLHENYFLLHTLSVLEHNSYSKRRKPTSVIPHKAFRKVSGLHQ